LCFKHGNCWINKYALNKEAALTCLVSFYSLSGVINSGFAQSSETENKKQVRKAHIRRRKENLLISEFTRYFSWLNGSVYFGDDNRAKEYSREANRNVHIAVVFRL
jgi:hypothetical protein